MEGGQVSDDYKASMLFSCSVVSNSLRPHGHSPPGSAVHKIFQARILEWIAILFSRRSSEPGNWTHSSCLAGALPLSTWETWNQHSPRLFISWYHFCERNINVHLVQKFLSAVQPNLNWYRILSWLSFWTS